MKSIQSEHDYFSRFLDMLENQLGANTEIVLHDYAKGYANSVVDIRNGHITGRTVGAGSSNLGLEVIRGNLKDGDRYNYITHTKSGKILRSSSMFIYDDDGKPIGAICVNTDITATVQLENYLHTVNNYDLQTEPVNEILDQNIYNVMEELIKQAVVNIGKAPAEMNREEKIHFIQFLDQHGVFLITKSSDKVCELLDISRYTFYNYLGHKKDDEPKDDAAEKEPAAQPQTQLIPEAR